MNNIDPKKLAEILGSSRIGGEEKQNLQHAVDSGDLSSFLNKLSPAQSSQLQQILSDKAKTEQLLSTPQAKMLLKKLIGNK